MKKEKYRLKFHLMPPKGWLNDPNGLCWYQGNYHVFFQYSPDGLTGKRKVWGHYVSPNLINWEYWGEAIENDREWDRDGAYSGSSLTEDGSLELFYTGNVKEEGDFDYIHSGRQANVICSRSEDGKTFSQKELLMTNQDYPMDYTCHVRDPKVWKENGQYYMVLGGRKNKDQGAVLLYQSPDKRKWKRMGEITTRNPFGYMWECPDLFLLSGQQILMCCPQGLEASPGQFMNQYQSGYFLCPELEYKNGVGQYGKELQKGVYWCKEAQFFELDYGFDFYAPQTFTDQHGRRLLIGWAGVPDSPYGNEPTVKEGWQQALTVPRELSLKNGRIFQYPVKEISLLRDQKLEEAEADGELQKIQNMREIKAEAFDVCISISEPAFQIRFQEDLVFQVEGCRLTLKFLNNNGCGRTLRTAVSQQPVRQIRILKDTSMIEIYVNFGELVFTSMYFPENTKETRLEVTGAKGLEIWSLKEMEVKIPMN